MSDENFFFFFFLLNISHKLSMTTLVSQIDFDTEMLRSRKNQNKTKKFKHKNKKKKQRKKNKNAIGFNQSATGLFIYPKVSVTCENIRTL